MARRNAAADNAPVWSRRARALRWAPLQEDAHVDICVVGLGYSGLAAVSAALDAGASVVGLDAGLVASGAAGSNGGFVLAGLAIFYHEAVARLGRSRASALYRLTLDEMDTMLGAVKQASRTGSLRIASSEAELLDCGRQADALVADGFRASTYDGQEGAGILLPDDDACDPLARSLAAADIVADRGARLHEQTLVHAVRTNRVDCAGGTVHCDGVVVAVDGGLEELLPALAGRIRTTRLQMLATAPVGRVVATRPVYARYGFEYYQQLDDGRIALGGYRDRHETEEWGAPAEPSAGVQADLETFLREGLGVRAPITHRWAARVAYTEDRLPILEEYLPRVHIAGAYSGVGNVLGSLCARAAAARALGTADLVGGLL